MANSSKSTHCHHIQIVPSDIDDMGHVNNAIYLEWVQQAAIGYWNRVASPDEVNDRLWVALKHDIEYKRPAFLSDSIDALVTAEEIRGPRAAFTTIIKRGDDVLAKIKSSWCCLDASTRRPVRIAVSEMA